jgi:hypothetical protein
MIPFVVIFFVATLGKEGDWNCVWRHVMEKRFRNTDAEKLIRRAAECKNKEQWRKIGIYMLKYKERR